MLLIGRGAAYPALSVSLGERMGVVGAFSIEAAAKHLNTRDIDGIVLGEGFTPRVVDAFLTVLCGGCALPQPAGRADIGRTGARPTTCPISKSFPASPRTSRPTRCR